MDLIGEQAARRPDAIAVSFEGDALTYGELDARSTRLARHIQSLGVGPESLVCVCLERGLEMVVAVLAVLKAGGAYVPLDPAFPAERLRYTVEDSGAKVLVTQRALSETFFSGLDLVRVCLDDDKDQIDQQSSEPLSTSGRSIEPGVCALHFRFDRSPQGRRDRTPGIDELFVFDGAEPGLEKRTCFWR